MSLGCSPSRVALWVYSGCNSRAICSRIIIVVGGDRAARIIPPPRLHGRGWEQMGVVAHIGGTLPKITSSQLRLHGAQGGGTSSAWCVIIFFVTRGTQWVAARISCHHGIMHHWWHSGVVARTGECPPPKPPPPPAVAPHILVTLVGSHAACCSRWRSACWQPVSSWSTNARGKGSKVPCCE